MRSFLIVCTLPFVIAACSPVRTAIPQTSVPIPTTAIPNMTSTAGLIASPQSVATQSSAPTTSHPTPEALQVLSPQDDAVVSTQQVTVTGLASPGAVVTVNDDILIAGPDGQWQDRVTLDEGLNVIEIIASNTSGSEASVELTVTYEP